MLTRPEQSSPVEKACRNDRTSHNIFYFFKQHLSDVATSLVQSFEVDFSNHSP